MVVQIHKDFSRLSEQDLQISVQLASGSRTATEDDDFSFDAANFVFLPSDQEMDVSLTIVNDNIPEGVESFTLTVVYSSPLSDPQNITTEIFIRDDDSKYMYVAHAMLNTAARINVHVHVYQELELYPSTVFLKCIRT